MTTRGGFGTLVHLIRSAPYHLKNTLSLQALQRRHTPADGFDSAHNGIDTAGIVELSNLKIVDTDWKFGHGYQAIRPQDFSLLFKALPLDYGRFVFLDIGSGKGRALLLASANPYEAIIGVELAQALHAIAQSNIQTFPASKKICKNIKSVCINVLNFSLPPKHLVVFMYNPFTERVLGKFVQQLVSSVAAHPRDVYLYYWNDLYADVLASAGLKAILGGQSAAGDESWSIYKIPSASESQGKN